MPAQMVALTEGPNILLDKPILLFGRHPECDIQIDSRKISRRHCCIAQVGDYLVIRDLGSTNGIRINGVRVIEGRLRAGDELTIGSHRYQIRWDDLAISSSGRHGSIRAPAKPGVLYPPASKPVPEDDLLEECDEPVPLQEEEDVAVAKSNRRAVSADDAEDERPKSMPSPKAKDYPPPLIVPDELELAPSSDVVRPVSTPRAADDILRSVRTERTPDSPSK